MPHLKLYLISSSRPLQLLSTDENVTNMALEEELRLLKEELERKNKLLVRSNEEIRQLHNKHAALAEELRKERRHPSRSTKSGDWMNVAFQEWHGNSTLREEVERLRNAVRLVQEPENIPNGMTIHDIMGRMEYLFSQCDGIFPTVGDMCPRMPSEDMELSAPIAANLKILNIETLEVNESHFELRTLTLLGNAHNVVCALAKAGLQRYIFEGGWPGSIQPVSELLGAWRDVIMLQQGQNSFDSTCWTQINSS